MLKGVIFRHVSEEKLEIFRTERINKRGCDKSIQNNKWYKVEREVSLFSNNSKTK